LSDEKARAIKWIRTISGVVIDDGDVATASEPSAAPDAFCNETLNVSPVAPSANESSTIGTEIGFEVSPGANVNVPVVAK
jgi:hypothetical protein